MTFPWPLRNGCKKYAEEALKISNIILRTRVTNLISWKFQVETIIRIIQKHAMEILDEKWIEFICTDAISFYERNGMILNPEDLEAIVDSITDIWASDTKPRRVLL